MGVLLVRPLAFIVTYRAELGLGGRSDCLRIRVRKLDGRK